MKQLLILLLGLSFFACDSTTNSEDTKVDSIMVVKKSSKTAMNSDYKKFQINISRLGEIKLK